jgi:hypothetical protein
MTEVRLYPTVSRRHGDSKIGWWWTFELVGCALDRYHQCHLRVRSVLEVRGGIDDFPSYATVWKMYGSFGDMLRRHGYRVRSRGRPAHIGNRRLSGSTQSAHDVD